MKDEAAREEDRIESHDYYKYKVSYLTKKDLDLTVLFVTGLTDKFVNIKKELLKCMNEFINLFEDILQGRFEPKTFEVFDPIVDSIHRNLRPKISLVGFSGVGKTTITKLIRAEEIPMQHIPTITGDIATVRIGKLHFHLWDFAGQEQFSYLWNNFIKGSDAVLLITDSTLENVDKSKFFLELIKDQAPHAHTAIIGNKQDLKGAVNPAQIERILGLKSYSMIANNPENRDKMIQIIADILEMSAEVSPLLKPLLERDKLIEEATRALEDEDFDKAAFLFDKISYLCIDLGDDSLGKEFFEKSNKIKRMLEQVDNPQPTPVFPIENDKIEKSKPLKKPEVKVITSKPMISVKALEIPKPQPKTPPEISTQNNALDHKIPTVEQVSSKGVIKSSKKLSTQDRVITPQTESRKKVLKLNPEDFMVKIRPKTIGVIPKDAKSKIKTSAFGHVKNVSQLNKKAYLNQTQDEKPVEMKATDESSKLNLHTPLAQLLKKDTKITHAQKVIPFQPTEHSDAPKSINTANQTQKVMDLLHPTSNKEETQVEIVKKKLIELKLKKADLNKMKLDYDIKELAGEMSAEEHEKKKEKIGKYDKMIDEQIQELEKLLKD
ncbi:MAG: GTP-binding protein [Promethearchaeota archaeon]|nr:MAG: GTP-binding protein [Candidatus Lokiarchaeota archaeon]